MKDTIRTTHIKVEFETSLGDSFSKDVLEEDRKALIEDHIKDWCDEHEIDRQDVKIISSSDNEED